MIRSQIELWSLVQIDIIPERINIAISFFRRFLRTEFEDAPDFIQDGAVFCVALIRVGHLVITNFLLNSFEFYALATLKGVVFIAAQVDNVRLISDGLPHR
jgi:hypothetical protein